MSERPDDDAQYAAVVEITPTKVMAWGQYGEGRWSGDEVNASSIV